MRKGICQTGRYSLCSVLLSKIYIIVRVVQDWCRHHDSRVWESTRELINVELFLKVFPCYTYTVAQWMWYLFHVICVQIFQMSTEPLQENCFDVAIDRKLNSTQMLFEYFKEMKTHKVTSVMIYNLATQLYLSKSCHICHVRVRIIVQSNNALKQHTWSLSIYSASHFIVEQDWRC